MATNDQLAKYKVLLANYKYLLAQADEAYYKLLEFQSNMVIEDLEGNE